jgi:5-aminolevulinate synthase
MLHERTSVVHFAEDLATPTSKIAHTRKNNAHEEAASRCSAAQKNSHVENQNETPVECASRIDYTAYFTTALDKIKQERRYREFIELERDITQFPRACWHRVRAGVTERRDVVIWCSNDYLGMGRHPAVITAMQHTAAQVGVGAGGTRNIAGTSTAIVSLEHSLADLHGKEAALVFTSGYVSNATGIATIAKLIPDCVLISDEKNHNSMIEGVRGARQEKIIFRHNDAAHLEEILQSLPYNRPKIILFESIYSMDGDVAPIHAFCDLAAKYNALTYLDEVHAVGLYGARGAGYAEEVGAMHRIDIVEATLAKGFGCIGGYLAGNATLIDAVRCYAHGFIFTTALPPPVAAAAEASVEHLKHSQVERAQHRRQVARVKQVLLEMGLPILPTKTHIVPVMVRDAAKAKAASDHLLEQHGIYVQPINYPTVPRGAECLRITPTPFHDEAMIQHLKTALFETFQRIA